MKPIKDMTVAELTDLVQDNERFCIMRDEPFPEKGTLQYDNFETDRHFRLSVSDHTEYHIKGMLKQAREPKSPKEKVFILAGREMEVLRYCQENGISPRNVVSINQPEDIRGYRGIKVIFVGSYYRKDNYQYIKDYLVAADCILETEKQKGG